MNDTPAKLALTCTWCSRPLEKLRPRPQCRPRFCCDGHRNAFWQSLREYASIEFENGQISIKELHLVFWRRHRVRWDE